MRDNASRVAREYAEAVFARTRVPIEPAGFAPDWADQPARFKRYPAAVRFPLDTAIPDRIGSVDGLPALAALLRLSYGLLSRRMDVNANNDVDVRVSYPGAVWGRGSASGGGLYPLELYWVAGASGPVLPG